MSQRDKPRLALNNITAGVRESEDANRTREAGCLDQIQGGVANTLNGARGKRSDMDGQAEGRANGSERVKLFRNGAAACVGLFAATNLACYGMKYTYFLSLVS